MKSITFATPLPPSVNEMYFNLPHNQGRAKTKKYKDWQKHAMVGYHHQGGFSGPVGVDIRIPMCRRSDADNRIKAILDFMVMHGVIKDDRYVDDLRIRKMPEQSKGTCFVEVWSLTKRKAA